MRYVIELPDLLHGFGSSRSLPDGVLAEFLIALFQSPPRLRQTCFYANPREPVHAFRATCASPRHSS